MNVSILNGCECQVTQRDRQLLRQLDSLYAFYHKQWWCYRELYRYYKRWRTVLNAMTLLIVALGMIVGPVFKNSVAATCITAVGMMVKGWNDFKKFSLKMDMCRFAYTSYAKTLSELRTHVRGSPLEEFVAFLVKIQTIDDTVTDFTPTLPDRYHISYKLKFCYKPIQFKKKEENEETKCLQKDKNDNNNDTSISKSLENVNEEEV